MTTDLAALGWPAARLGEALQALAQRSGLAPAGAELPSAPGRGPIGPWIEVAAGCVGFEAESIEPTHADVARIAGHAGPALLRLPGDGDATFLALMPGHRRRATILGPDLAVHAVDPEAMQARSDALAAPVGGDLDALLDEAGMARRRRHRLRAALLRERRGTAPFAACWLLRLPPAANAWRQALEGALPHRLAGLAAVRAVEYGLWLVAWWMVGRGALDGRLDSGWLLSWALLLLTLVPLRLAATWWEGRLAVGAGALLKRRLLHGALRLEPEEVRRQGVGQLLGRVLEADAVESLALSGGFLALEAGIELVLAAAVLTLGAGGRFLAALLGGWVVVTLFLAQRHLRRRARWTDARLDLTHDLVERLVGHRTRQAQEERERWHESEDEALTRYLGVSRAMDTSAARLAALAPRGWLALGLAGLTPSFVAGTASPPALAVALGGVLLAEHALRRLVASLANAAGAVIAWQRVAPLYRAAARPERRGVPGVALPGASDGDVRAPADGRPLLDAHDLVFRYRGRGDAILRGVSLQVRPGDRLLLEGPSGAGKSTLASLLTGLREPESGLLLLEGLDERSLGSAAWRRRVVAAPQFHENHVLAGTFAFNLLMGRPWPTSTEEFREIEAVCHELGLGDLLERMPAGLMQMVGETGWQLSHGERSRVYIARALLQRADLIILDESFAALDPETLAQALRCVLARARSLLVIAHP
jgi:ATP-binding cassette subfamily B protein